jgi:hypothetical protein
VSAGNTTPEQPYDPQRPRISDRCPSCGGMTLFIGAGGWLTCSLIGCKRPALSDSIAAERQKGAMLGRGAKELDHLALSSMAEMLKKDKQTISELSEEARIMVADYDALVARINSIYELMRCRETKGGRHQWRVSPMDGSADGWCKRCGVLAQTIVETVQVAEGLCPIGPAELYHRRAAMAPKPRYEALEQPVCMTVIRNTHTGTHYTSQEVAALLNAQAKP